MTLSVFFPPTYDIHLYSVIQDAQMRISSLQASIIKRLYTSSEYAVQKQSLSCPSKKAPTCFALLNLFNDVS